jgi:chromosome segregation ATPase
MENKEFLEALENLKKTLTGIDSAKKQVESTIQAYAALQSSIDNYGKKLDPIAVLMSSIVATLVEKQEALVGQANTIISSFEESVKKGITKLSNECDSIKTSFDAKIKESIADFATKQQEELNKLAYLNGQLDTSVQSLTSVGQTIKEAKVKIEEVANSISILKNEIAASQKSQDDAIARLSIELSAISNSNNQSFSEIITALSDNYNSLLAAVNAIVPLVNNVSRSMTDLHAKVDTLYMKVDNLSATATESKSKIYSYESSIQKIAKSVTFTKIMLIVSILLSLLLLAINLVNLVK